MSGLSMDQPQYEEQLAALGFPPAGAPDHAPSPPPASAALTAAATKSGDFS